MSRIFRRGELRSTLLHILADGGPASGYALMRELADRVGGGWRPSPGAIYPALLALEDAGHVTSSDDDGTRVYALTGAGRRACDDRAGVLADLAGRHPAHDEPTTLGAVLDAFAQQTPRRSERLDPRQVAAVTTALTNAGRQIADVTTPGSIQ